MNNVQPTDPLNEFINLSPMAVYKTGEIDGVEIYSRRGIIDRVKKEVEYSPITIKIKNAIYKGIHSGNIKIGYTKEGKRGLVKRRVKAWARHRLNLDSPGIEFGWYSIPAHQIAIVLDDNVDILGQPLYNVPSILSHELCHMAAFESPNNYLSTMMESELYPYYYHVLSHFDSRTKDISKVELVKLIKYLTDNCEGSKQFTPFRTIYGFWRNYFSNIEQNEKSLDDLTLRFLSPHIYFMMEKKSSEMKNNAIISIKSLYYGYDKLGVNARKYTTPYQELRCTSEVMCILNQFKQKPEVVRLINSIDMG